jgi:hypothetical protein
VNDSEQAADELTPRARVWLRLALSGAAAAGVGLLLGLLNLSSFNAQTAPFALGALVGILVVAGGLLFVVSSSIVTRESRFRRDAAVHSYDEQTAKPRDGLSAADGSPRDRFRGRWALAAVGLALCLVVGVRLFAIFTR